MTELQILNIVKNNKGSIGFYEILNFGKTDSVWEPATDQALLEKLINTKTLSSSAGATPMVYMNDSSRLRLKELQQEADSINEQIANERAKENRQRKHDFRMAFLTAALTTVSTVATQFLILFLSQYF